MVLTCDKISVSIRIEMKRVDTKVRVFNDIYLTGEIPRIIIRYIMRYIKELDKDRII